MVDYADIGKRIRACRLAKGMTQEQLANEVGVVVTHISHIETGNSVPSLKTLIDIINAMPRSALQVAIEKSSRIQSSSPSPRMLIRTEPTKYWTTLPMRRSMRALIWTNAIMPRVVCRADCRCKRIRWSTRRGDRTAIPDRARRNPLPAAAGRTPRPGGLEARHAARPTRPGGPPVGRAGRGSRR